MLRRHKSEKPANPAVSQSKMNRDILIETSVQIRPFCGEDSSALYAAACESKDALFAGMTWFRPNYTMEDAARFVRRSSTDWYAGDRYDFAIVDELDDSLCGSVSLNHIDRRHRFANVGFWVRRSRLRRGIASNAVRLIIDFAFKKLELVRLEFLIAQSNRASQCVARKIGAELEGTLRKRLTLSGEPEDALLFSLLKEDWELAVGA
jgi:ribosomal-protein-serine acetyltransferase